VIDPATSVGTVGLTVSDLSRSRSFYESALGLEEKEPGSFGAPGRDTLLELHEDPSAPRLDGGATGLFHFALLLPSRADLARSLRRLSEAGWRLTGASDHLVSEALYLSDPDGNGIELYRDRPREEWPRQDGSIQMATIPLDLHSLSREASDAHGTLPAGTLMGHVHLKVSDLDDAERFYNRVLGFDVTVRGYPGALFFSAGGYHHHVGVNTWQSAGASPPPSGSVGLRSFQVLLPDSATLERMLERVHAAGIEHQPLDGGALVRDPAGNGVLLTSR
jgi:catechol 2,3-dioxygenase